MKSEYTIIKENKNEQQEIPNLEQIKIPYFPVEIMDKFLNDYQFIKNYLDYKRDATLALLNIYNIIAIHDDTFNLNVEKQVKNWDEFFELIKNYSKIFTLEGQNFYKEKEYNQLNNIFKLTDENFLGPIIQKIFYEIYRGYLKKFPYWIGNTGKQKNYINLELEDKIDKNNIRCYWNFHGIITIQDTQYDNPISFKSEFNGKPKFQIVLLDLNKFEDLRRNEQNLKPVIDKIDAKIIEQNMKDLCMDLEL